MSQAYLLLDGAQIDNLPHRLFELGCTMTYQALYQHTAYSGLLNISPVLVPVEAHSALAQTFTREWRATAGIWLESEQATAVVVQHLRSLVHARVEGDVTVLFRYYDPRITGAWLGDLEPQARDRLMGPVRLIVLPESLQAGAAIRQENPTQPIGQYASNPWLALGTEQLEQLGAARRHGLAQQLIKHCQEHFPHTLHGLDDAAQQQWAAQCQRSAGLHGYGAIGDVARWASFHAVLGDDFPDASGHAVYRQLLNEPGVLPEQRLDDLSAELQRQLLTDKERLV